MKGSKFTQKKEEKESKILTVRDCHGRRKNKNSREEEESFQRRRMNGKEKNTEGRTGENFQKPS